MKQERLSVTDKENTRCRIDQREDEAYNVMRIAASRMVNKDEATLFGEMVASKIRKLSAHNQAIAQNHVNNYLFKLEMEELAATTSPHYLSYSPSPPATTTPSPAYAESYSPSPTATSAPSPGYTESSAYRLQSAALTPWHDTQESNVPIDLHDSFQNEF